MSKNNKKRVKFDKDGNPTDKRNRPVSTHSDTFHKPRIVRFHLAQEYRDRQATELAEEVTRRLLPHLRGRVQGLRDDHYRFAGFRSTDRRTVRSVDA